LKLFTLGTSNNPTVWIIVPRARSNIGNDSSGPHAVDCHCIGIDLFATVGAVGAATAVAAG